jgi:hypothetical protein
MLMTGFNNCLTSIFVSQKFNEPDSWKIFILLL